MRKLRSYRPTAPMVINLIALSIVLGGHAYALTGASRVKKDDIAVGAITARNLARSSVSRPKLASHAVTESDLANGSVTGRTISRGSVDGLTLAGTFQPVANLPDADSVVDFTWTPSAATVACPADAVLLNGGIRIEDSGNHRGFLQSTFPSSSNGSTWVGGISTDTGGASPGLLYAHCLR